MTKRGGKRLSVLIIGNDASMHESIRVAYQAAEFSVQAAAARDALRLAPVSMPDLVVLDLDAPDAAEVLSFLRAWSNLPAVMVVSARSSEADKLACFEAGADDYLVKPFGLPELMARSRAALRRCRGDDRDVVLELGSLAIEMDSRRAVLDGKPLKLTNKEFQVLHALARRSGRLVTHHRLLEEIWGPAHVKDTHYLRIVMQRLRRKIERDAVTPCRLITEPGLGYRLVAADEPSAELRPENPDATAEDRSFPLTPGM